MLKKYLLIFLFIPAFCQAQHVFKTDLDNFWTMRDSIMATSDTARQMDIVKRLYIARASDGLKAFMRNKDNPAAKWLGLIKTRPLFWDSLNMKMPQINAALPKLEMQVGRFQKLYPELKPAQTYFLIGLLQQGGTIRGNLSLLCVDVILKDQTIHGDQLVRMGIHEYVHTQQKRPDFQKINVLTSSIREGACDLVAQLVTGIRPKTPYMAFGPKHEKEVWAAFEKEMYTQNNDNWVSTGYNPKLLAPDLGYFVGYQVCKAYYDKAADKKIALKEIIELDYADEKAVKNFLEISGYNGK